PSAPPLPSRRRRPALTQLPRVPSLTPRSRATCAIGLPVSRTSRTAPSRKSRSNFLRVSPLGELLSLMRISPRWEGKPSGLHQHVGRWTVLLAVPEYPRDITSDLPIGHVAGAAMVSSVLAARLASSAPS